MVGVGEHASTIRANGGVHDGFEGRRGGGERWARRGGGVGTGDEEGVAGAKCHHRRWLPVERGEDRRPPPDGITVDPSPSS